LAAVPLRLFLVAPSAMLTDTRPHGDGLVAYGFIRELAKRGHDLQVAAGVVDLREAPPPNLEVHALGGGDNLAAIERTRFMRRMRRLYRELASAQRFDVVHQLTPVEVGVTLALADRSVPVVLGPYVPEWPSGDDVATVQSPRSVRVKQALRATQQLEATTVLLSNPAAEEKVSPRARRRLYVHELPLGVDDHIWIPAATDEHAEDVLFLASLDIRKGVYVLLDAFALLAEQFPDARLRLVGAGPELEEVRRRIAASPAPDRIDVLGHLDREFALGALQTCDVYCLPSFGDPHPLTVLEAMSCARPVVVTDAGGLPHLVPDAGGRKVPAGDAEALAGALAELLRDRELRREMGAVNRRVVEERYAWSRVVDRLEAIYEEAMR
jgi:L-malate glycosyltransferase